MRVLYHKIEIDDEVSLSRVEWRDAEKFVDHLNEKQIRENTLSIPTPYTLDDALRFIQSCRNYEFQKGKQCSWAIRRDDQLIGGIGFRIGQGRGSHVCEIGYWLAAAERGKGLMTKVIRRFSSFCLDTLGFARVEALTFLYNAASARALENAGFLREGIMRRARKKGDQFFDTVVYSRVDESRV